MARVLVFAPHPDDDIIGCGGSIAKHVRGGSDVTVVYMTSGDAGSLKYSKGELAKMREAEAKNAAKVLGVKDLVFLGNADGYLECNKENLVKTVDLIRNKNRTWSTFPTGMMCIRTMRKPANWSSRPYGGRAGRGSRNVEQRHGRSEPFYATRSGRPCRRFHMLRTSLNTSVPS